MRGCSGQNSATAQSDQDTTLFGVPFRVLTKEVAIDGILNLHRLVTYSILATNFTIIVCV